MSNNDGNDTQLSPAAHIPSPPKFELLRSYHAKLVTCLENNGCKVEKCLKAFEFGSQNDTHYPHISRVCQCTICWSCLQKQLKAACKGDVEKTKKGWTYTCPLCNTHGAWNNEAMLPNIAFANIYEELHRLSASVATALAEEEASDVSSPTPTNKRKQKP